MALTFDEIFSSTVPFDPGNSLEYPVVTVTLVLTQEDGRTGYAQGLLFVDHASGVLRGGVPGENFNDLQISIYFNDRSRFAGPADQLGMRISRTSTGIHVIEWLLTWNAQEQITLEEPSNLPTVGRVYVGRGPAIGGGLGQAVNCLSFNGVSSVPVIS